MSKVVKKKVEKNNTDVDDIVDKLGGWDNFLQEGEKVLIKPNFNTADDPPASTDINFLKSVIESVEQKSPGQVVVGESCTYFHCTNSVFNKKQVEVIEQETGAEVVNFDNGEWFEREIIDSDYLESVKVPRILKEVDRIILVPALKTHFLADYTGAMKISVGFMYPKERLRLHLRKLQEKIAELNLIIDADLILMDARKCFIAGGPADGEVKQPGYLMGATDPLALDLEGVKIIKGYAGNSLENKKPEEIPQFKKALNLELGDEDYNLIEI